MAYIDGLTRAFLERLRYGGVSQVEDFTAAFLQRVYGEGLTRGRAVGFEKGLAIGAIIGAGIITLAVASYAWWLS